MNKSTWCSHSWEVIKQLKIMVFKSICHDMLSQGGKKASYKATELVYSQKKD